MAELVAGAGAVRARHGRAGPVPDVAAPRRRRRRAAPTAPSRASSAASAPRARCARRRSTCSPDGEALLLRILPEGEEAVPRRRPAPRTVVNPCLSGGAVEIFLEPRLPAPLLARRGHHADRRRGGRRSPSRSASPSSATATARPRPPAPPRCVDLQPRPRRGGVDPGRPRRRRRASSGSWPATRGAPRCSTRSASTDDERARVRTPVGVEIGATHRRGDRPVDHGRGRAGGPRRGSGRRRLPARRRRPPSRRVDPVCGMTVVIGPDTPHLAVDGARPLVLRHRAAATASPLGRRLGVTVTGLVLAAGSSTRLGRPKQLLAVPRARRCSTPPWRWPGRARSTSVVVTLGAAGRRGPRPRSTSRGVEVVENPDADRRAARRRSSPRSPPSTRRPTGWCSCSATSRACGPTPSARCSRAGADAPLGGRPLRRRPRPPVLVPARRLRRPRRAARRQGACGSCSSRAGTRCVEVRVAGPVPARRRHLGGLRAPSLAARGACRDARPFVDPDERRRAGSTPSTTSSTRAPPPRSTSPPRSAGRCCSRASPGVGKTAAAKAHGRGARRAAHPAAVLRGPHRRRGALRVELPAPAARHPAGRGRQGRSLADADLFTEEFLLERPILRCVRHQGPVAPVLLIDEIDRADDEFEALLFEFLGEGSVTIPELGTFTAEHPPVVVLTSNRSRELHDALKRRCLYHWIDYPERGPGRRDRPPVGARRQRAAGAGGHRVRRPGARARPRQGARPGRGDRLGVGPLRPRRHRRSSAHDVVRTLGAVVKTPDDRDLVRRPRSTTSASRRPAASTGPLRRRRPGRVRPPRSAHRLRTGGRARDR